MPNTHGTIHFTVQAEDFETAKSKAVDAVVVAFRASLGYTGIEVTESFSVEREEVRDRHPRLFGCEVTYFSSESNFTVITAALERAAKHIDATACLEMGRVTMESRIWEPED